MRALGTSAAFARIVDELVADPAGPSAVVLTASDRTEVLAREARGAPVGASFDVASLTKVAVTTPSIMTLVDRRALSLDASVHRWYPAIDPAVTVRDLLEHQGGRWEWWPLYVAGAKGRDAALALAASLPARYPVRSGRHYSDLGFMLLGGIVEEVGGRALHAPCGVTAGPPVPTSRGDGYERRIVETGTPYPVTADAASFGGWREHLLVGEINDGNAYHAFGGLAGHAGLFATAADLVRLGCALLDSLAGSGPWSADVVAEFFRPGRDPGQGLGWRVAGPLVWHGGFTGTRFGLLPASGLVAVLLTNAVGRPAAVEEAWNRIVRSLG
ncbi:MAG: serine hydrolase domain-containing protein [Mycobacteriales bacterium]